MPLLASATGKWWHRGVVGGGPIALRSSPVARTAMLQDRWACCKAPGCAARIRGEGEGSAPGCACPFSLPYTCAHTGEAPGRLTGLL